MRSLLGKTLLNPQRNYRGLSSQGERNSQKLPPWKGTWWRFAREEDGRVLLLGLGACVLLSTLILMSMSVSGIYLEQRRLQRLADQTASMAASHVEDAEYYQEGFTESVPLHIDQAEAASRAQSYLAGANPKLRPGLKNIAISKIDTQPTRVEVELVAKGIIPIPLPLISDLSEVSLRARAIASLKASFG